MSRPNVWGILYALRAAIYIYVVGGRLTPDSGLYAQGKAAWSSPVAALAGSIAGYQGVCLVGIAGAFALGSIVARNSRGILAPTALALSPPGWYAMEPSADAAGAAGATWAVSRPWRYSYLVLVASLHLEAALVILGSRIVGRYIPLRLDFVATGMGALACLAQWHIQVRYLLPGVALIASHRLTFCKRSSEDSTNQRTLQPKTLASPYLKVRWYWEQ